MGYAQADLFSNVGQEERASVRVALQSVRPMLQTWAQRQLDRLDQQYPEVRCSGCRCRMEPLYGQGMGSKSGNRTRLLEKTYVS